MQNSSAINQIELKYQLLASVLDERSRRQWAATEARAYGLAVDPETTTFFIGRETLLPSENPVLGRWRTWLYMQLASNALSPARFYHLPPNRVVELGTQVTI